MRKLIFLIAAVAMVTAACQQEVDVQPMTEYQMDAREQISPYAISEEEAVEKLEGFMLALDGDETRSKKRMVRSIHKVSYNNVIGQTRSSDDDNIENLLYIVEFEDGEGSAVLGADRRLEPVYAVLDETILTVEDFSNAVAGENIDNLSTYTAGLISDNVLAAIIDFGDPGPVHPPLDSLRTDITYYTTTTTVVSKVLPLLTTKWGQRSPYNDKFPFTDTGYIREPAGCGTIAVAQVLNYLTYPNNLVLNGHIHDWSIITQFVYNNDIDNIYYKNCIAQFIYDLALEMNVTYEPEDGTDWGTIVAVEDSEALFKQLGYKNVNFETLTASKAYNMIFNNKPFYAYGVDATHVVDDDDVAHAWVIDGWMETHTVVREIVEDQGTIISNTISDQYNTQYAHCNFGWEGKCDGYYTFNIFNTRVERPDDMIETDYGDYSGIDQWKFTELLKMIKYNY